MGEEKEAKGKEGEMVWEEEAVDDNAREGGRRQ
jgi:hypothetical protein